MKLNHKIFIAAAFIFQCLGMPSINAQENINEKKEEILYGDDRPERHSPGLRMARFREYNEVMELLMLEPPDQENALLILLDRDFTNSKRINAYERAIFYNLIASIYQSQEKYTEALKYYKLVLEQDILAMSDQKLALDQNASAIKGGMAIDREITSVSDRMEIPYDLLDSVNFLIGQIYFTIGEFETSHIYLNNWLIQQPDPPANNLIFIANAYYYAGMEEGQEKSKSDDFIRTSIALVNQAINRDRLNAKEEWYVFLRMLHENFGEDQRVFEITEILVTNWPKKQYWLDLSGLYARFGSKDGLSEEKVAANENLQMVVFEIAHRQGMLTVGRELESMSQLFLYHEIPYKSSKTLDKAIRDGVSEGTHKNYDLLSMAYLKGKDMDKSIEPLSKAAALSEDGELYMRLANVYLQLDMYSEATESIDLGLEKGDIRRPDLALFLQGQAYMYLERFDDARVAFREAANDERTEKNASTWLEYIDREEQRIKDIREYLN